MRQPTTATGTPLKKHHLSRRARLASFRLFAVISLLSMIPATQSLAQTFTEQLQRKTADGQGTITIIHSKEIDELVNGRAELPKIVKPEHKTKDKDKNKEKGNNPKTQPTAHVDTVNIDTGKKVIVGGTKVTGYRVQVFSGGNSREDKIKAQRIGAEVKALFPEQPVYVHFLTPHWVCRIGNFRNNDDANELLHELRQKGYGEACLIKGKITVQ